ncbi:MAG: transcription antitermination protein NusB [Rikenellaceae bacterium]
MLSRRLLRIKTVKALYSHFKSETETMVASEKNLLNAIDKTYQLYHQMLYLIVDVKRYGESRLELAKQKHLATKEDLNPNTRFIDNPVIDLIEQSTDLNAFMTRFALGWAKYPEMIKIIYDALIESDFYKDYMNLEKSTFKQDLKFVSNFYIKLIEDNPEIERVVEEQSILWMDDIDFSLIMVIRTLESIKAGDEEIKLLDKFKNDDDREFVVELFRKTLVNYKSSLDYVERFTKNWDVDRIAFMDILVMVTSVTEFVTFPTIPVKVTMNEYIEIAKYYSTTESNLFINGVLDKIITELKSENKLNKIGTGLL